MPTEPPQAGPHSSAAPPGRASLKLADFLLGHPRLMLCVVTASALISFVFSLGLRFDFTPQAIYRTGDDLVAYAEEFKQTFGYDESVVLIVLEATGEVDAVEAPALEWQAEVVRDLRRIPAVRRVESLATLEIPRLTWSGLTLSPLIDQRPINAEGANRVRGWLSVPSLIHGRLLSSDQTVAGMPVFLDPSGGDIEAMRRTVSAVEACVAQHPAPEGYRVHLTGLPVLRVDVVENLRSDLLRLMPLAAAVYVVVLALLFRRASDALLPLLAVGVGVAWTLAALAVFKTPLNVVSNILPVLLMIVGVSSSVQIVSCYADEWAGGARDVRTAARDAIARMTPACLLAAVTTAIGFVSLATAHSLLLKQFGLQAALGVGLQYASALVTLGTLFRYFDPPRTAVHSEARPGLITRAAGAAGFWVAGRPWWTLVGGALVVGLAVLAGSRVQINSFAILETYPADDPAVKTLKLVEDRLSGIMPLEVSLHADDSEVLLEPDVFHRILQFEDAVQREPAVLTVDSYADVFRDVLVHWPGRRRSESNEKLVPSGSAGIARLARIDRFVHRFPEAFHIDTYLAADGQRARIRVRLREIGSRQTLQLISRIESRLAEAFPADGPIKARLTGEAYVNAQALNTLIHDLYYSLLTASLVIFGLIAIEFRSLRVGLIAAIPNLTPLAVTLGYMGLRGYDMNVSNVIVFTISLGLADDNTIHFLYRFREELHVDGNVSQAIRRAFLSTGRAIVATSILLLAGLAVLLFSHFVPTRNFAELTQVTVLGNLLGVLLLLPASLVLFWKERPR